MKALAGEETNFEQKESEHSAERGIEKRGEVRITFFARGQANEHSAEEQDDAFAREEFAEDLGDAIHLMGA